MKFGWFKTFADLYINFDKDEGRMIIVTGLSGSGKSYTASLLSDKYNYLLLSFDVIFGYSEEREITAFEKEIVERFRSEYKIEELSSKKQVCKYFFGFVKRYIEKEDLRIVFEGSYFLDKVDVLDFADQRIVVKRTSLILGMVRRLKRNGRYIKVKEISLGEKVKEYYWLYRDTFKKIGKWYKKIKNFLRKMDELELEKRRITLEEQKRLQVAGLLYVKELCDKQQIPYFLTSGTLLGAVKYQGYIPWDDDIDICLMRNDYKRLIALIENDDNQRFEVLTVYNTKDYYYPYAKLVDRETMVVDNARKIEKMGVFIDIFPLDYFDEEAMAVFKRTRIMRNMAARRMQIKNNIMKTNLLVRKDEVVRFRRIKNVIYQIIDWLSRPLGYNFWARWLDRVLSRKEQGKYLAILYKGIPLIFDKELFLKRRDFQFENNTFSSVMDADGYLRKVYGDYWLDPPLEKQKTHHQICAYYRKSN